MTTTLEHRSIHTPADTSADTSSSAAADRTAELLHGWLALWNGDLTQADLVLHPDFCTHAAMTDGGDGSDINSPKALAAWVAATRSVIPDLHFSVQVGPISASDHLVLRWRAQGTYAGGVPASMAPAGTPVDFTGTDLLRVNEGLLAEYWVNSDTLLMLTQLRALG